MFSSGVRNIHFGMREFFVTSSICLRNWLFTATKKNLQFLIFLCGKINTESESLLYREKETSNSKREYAGLIIVTARDLKEKLISKGWFTLVT